MVGVCAVSDTQCQIRTPINKRHFEVFLTVECEQMNGGGGTAKAGTDDGNFFSHSGTDAGFRRPIADGRRRIPGDSSCMSTYEKGAIVNTATAVDP